jgi:putative nucleotidyltransferase with HDIG domain
MVEKMPPFPRSAHMVLQLSSDLNSDPKELVNVIEHDPVLLLKLLRIVNSPYFGLSQRITSVNHAVLYVGINTVKNLALSAAALGALPRNNAAGFDIDAFLTHSLAAAAIARVFAKKIGVPEKEVFDFFLAGLLHDFGKVVFANFMPNEFRNTVELAKNEIIPLYQAETEIFKTDHAQVGAMLAEKWQLPINLIEALRNHHSQNSGLSQITTVVSAADQIAKELGIGLSGSPVIDELPKEIIAMFGDDAAVVAASLGDVQSEIEKAMLFISRE